MQVALVQASLPTRTNQLHVNPRDSISGFLQSRFTNNEQKNEQMQCHSSGLVNRVQHFPTSYEGTHACTHAILGLSSNTWHKRMPHDSPFLSVGDDNSLSAKATNLSDSRSANARISLKQSQSTSAFAGMKDAKERAFPTWCAESKV